MKSSGQPNPPGLLPDVHWFGIRTIHSFGTKRDGTNLFEERFNVFGGANHDEAFAKAQKVAAEYAKPWHPEQIAYFLDDYFLDKPPPEIVEDFEVWSEVFEFPGTLDEFVAARYSKFDYHPDVSPKV